MNIELFLDARAVIAESPTWVSEEGALYWADVRRKTLNRIVLATLEQTSWSLPEEIGAFALGPEGEASAVVALRTGVFRLSLETGSLEALAPPPFDPAVMRFNEGACDPDGRFFVGVSFDPRPGVEAERFSGAVHSLLIGEALRPEADLSDLHNGMGFSPDGETFYVSHTHERRILAYDRAEDGRLGARRVFAETGPGLGTPDGAAMDAEGGYWCALHKGWTLRRYAEDGRVDQEVRLPVSRPTMCAFAGPDLELLIVTSASEKLSAEDLQAEPHAGGLFLLRPEIPGARKPARIARA